MLLFCLFLTEIAYANIVFPAIAHQFMVSMVVRSYYSVVMAVLILAIEAFFIRRLFLINFIWCLILAFTINLISSVFGVILTSVFFGRGDLVGISGILGYKDMRLGTYLGLIPGYVITFVLEGFLLALFALLIKRKLKLTSIFRASIVMNLFSYIVILLGVFIADIATRGQVFRTF